MFLRLPFDLSWSSMRQKESKAATPPHASDNGDQTRPLLEQSGEVAPIDIARYEKLAADIITRAAAKARERRGRKAQR